MATAPPDANRGLLNTLADRVRCLRRDRCWSRSELAERCGLSVRYLARVESGEGNISVLRLESLARALGTTAADLLSGWRNERIVVLVGLRGAGKSTVGPRLASRFDLPFVEVDDLIVEASGLAVDQLFELHGEPYYRRLERETLRRLVARGEAAVVAAAGGVVSDPATWEMLRSEVTVVWLRARPEDHWNRVVAQGDRRPMADHPAAMEALRGLLAAREASYAEATLTVDTSALSPDATATTVERQLRALWGADGLQSVGGDGR